MRNVPAIIARESDALAFARTEVAISRDNPAPLPIPLPGADIIGGSWFNPKTGRRMVVAFFTRAATSGPSGLLMVTDEAHRGWGEAQDVLKDLANEYFHSGRLAEMPPSLQDFQMRLNDGMLRRAHGPQRADKVLRDILIFCIVERVCERFGVKPTRNSEQKRRDRASACCIVHKALELEHPPGMTIPSERGIETIWNKYRRVLAPEGKVNLSAELPR